MNFIGIESTQFTSISCLILNQYGRRAQLFTSLLPSFYLHSVIDWGSFIAVIESEPSIVQSISHVFY